MSSSGQKLIELSEAVNRFCDQGKHQAALEVAKECLALAREDLGQGRLEVRKFEIKELPKRRRATIDR
jgi:hypothetical protein